MLKYSLLVLCIGACLAQDYEDYPQEQRSPSGASRFQYQSKQQSQTTTEAPVAILKQINRHNEDGSYTYGYEAADGSFKIETKAANGDVKGKYGYFDGEKVRVVEYGANRHGFQPSGEGITVPPPNLVDDREEERYEERPQRPAAPKQKFQKQPQPQYQPQPQVNYAPVVEKRKPEYAPQPQYYDYEEEVIATTPKAVQPPRPKFQQPQYSAAPVPPRPQFANAIPSDVTYADAKPQYKPQSQPQYESYESRQPAQFPQQEAPVQQSFSSNRPADFPLFTPVNSRVDAFKPRPQKVVPQQPRPQHTEAFIPQPNFQQPQYAPQPAPVQQPERNAFAPRPSQSRTPSILDQLAKDYAIPQSSAALHDISFGYSLN